MTLSVSEIAIALPHVLAAGRAPLIWGPPGVGKSQMVAQVASTLDYSIPENKAMAEVSPYLAERAYGKDFVGRKVFDVRLGLCSPTDLKGIPVFNTVDREAIWVNTSLFPMEPSVLAQKETDLMLAVRALENAKSNGASSTELLDIEERISRLETDVEQGLHEQHGFLFLDEITQAASSVQGAAFGLVLDKKVGTYHLPPDTHICAAGNRIEDKAGTNKMPTPLLSRFVQFHTDIPNVDAWCEWAAEAGIQSEIMGYLKYKPNALFQFKPGKGVNAQSAQSAYPCPRTWEFVSDILQAWTAPDSKDYLLTEVISGSVGGEAANEFMAWLKLYHKLPSPEVVLNDGNFDIKFENEEGMYDMSLEYAFIMNLCRHALRKESLPANSLSVDSKEAKVFMKRMDNLGKFVSRDKKKADWMMVVSHTIFDAKHLAQLKFLREVEGLRELMRKTNVGGAALSHLSK